MELVPRIEQKLESPGLVHPILTEDQAELTHQALIAFLNSPEGSLSEDETEDQRVRSALSELVFFFSNVVDHPESFGVRAALETKRNLRAVKPAKGEAQPKSKRKRRQRTRIGHEKRTRKQKRAEAEDYNRARQIMEDEAAEAEQDNHDEQVRRIERFNELLAKEVLRNEELQEALELLGFGNLAEAARTLRAEDDPQRRLDRAATQRDRGDGGEADEAVGDAAV